MEKPKKLYHGSSRRIDGPLQPILIKDLPDHIHSQPAVFGTARQDIAALFMFMPYSHAIFSIGFEQDIAYICIWGMGEDFLGSGHEGYLYVLPSNTFEKVGKEYEWQSFEEVMPIEVQHFDSVISGMMKCGAQVYFIHDDQIMDQIVADKHNRAPILKKLVSENQKRNVNMKRFS